MTDRRLRTPELDGVMGVEPYDYDPTQNSVMSLDNNKNPPEMTKLE